VTTKPIVFVQLDGVRQGLGLKTLDVLTKSDLDQMTMMKTKRLFWFLANLGTGNLIVEGSQKTRPSRISQFNSVYHIKYSPSENKLYIYNPLNKQTPTWAFPPEDCEGIYTILGQHERLRFFCWSFICLEPNTKTCAK
jgi:hypothetical protein